MQVDARVRQLADKEAQLTRRENATLSLENQLTSGVQKLEQNERELSAKIKQVDSLNDELLRREVQITQMQHGLETKQRAFAESAKSLEIQALKYKEEHEKWEELRLLKERELDEAWRILKGKRDRVEDRARTLEREIAALDQEKASWNAQKKDLNKKEADIEIANLSIAKDYDRLKKKEEEVDAAKAFLLAREEEIELALQVLTKYCCVLWH